MTKVAAIQMCSSDVLDDNLNTVELLIKKAAAEGALLAVLPEMFVLFGTTDSAKITIQEEQGFGKIQDFLAAIARKYNIWIVGGTIPIRSAVPTKVRAACLVFNNEGSQVARYDKIHLFDVTLSPQEEYKESNTTEPGTTVIVIETPIGRLGLCVCYDLRFPEVFAEFVKQGVEVIAAPSAFTAPTGEAHWKLLCRSRAIDTFCYVIGACQGGTHANGRATYGHAMIVNPWGEVIDEMTTSGNGVVYADVDLKNLYAIRKKIPVIKTIR